MCNGTPNDKQRIMQLEMRVAEITCVLGAMKNAMDCPNVNFNCGQCGNDLRYIEACSEKDCMNGL